MVAGKPEMSLRQCLGLVGRPARSVHACFGVAGTPETTLRQCLGLAGRPARSLHACFGVVGKKYGNEILF